MSDPDPFDVKPILMTAGVTQAPGASEQAPQKVELDLGKCKSLLELTQDYALYTPALLHLTVPLTFDPFDLFCEEYGSPVSRFVLRFEHPIFTGLVHPDGDASWCYTLEGMEKEHWEAFKSWVGTCAFNDSKRGILRRVRTQELGLHDPLNYHTNESIPVTALVIESNKGSFYYKPTHQLYAAAFDPALVYNDTRDFAEALRKEVNDPYQYMESKRNAREGLSTRPDGR